MKYFYSHIIEIESIYTILDVMDLDHEEKQELIVIIESTVHHTIIDTVLSELSEKDKKIFLHHLSKENHEDLWKHLKENIEKVEHKINRAVNILLQELHLDVQEAKKHIN